MVILLYGRDEGLGGRRGVGGGGGGAPELPGDVYVNLAVCLNHVVADLSPCFHHVFEACVVEILWSAGLGVATYHLRS